MLSKKVAFAILASLTSLSPWFSSASLIFASISSSFVAFLATIRSTRASSLGLRGLASAVKCLYHSTIPAGERRSLQFARQKQSLSRRRGTA